jgi:hypothetical protein
LTIYNRGEGGQLGVALAVAAELDAAGEDVLEEVVGELVGSGLLDALLGGEAEEGRAHEGAGGEEGGDFGELAGAAAVFEGVEVAFGCAGSPAGAGFGPARGGLSHRFALILRGFALRVGFRRHGRLLSGAGLRLGMVEGLSWQKARDG